MATTTPNQWPGTATMTDDKVNTIREWYLSALGDEDKAGDPNDCAFYEGWRSATEAVLNLLFDQAARTS